MSTLNKSSRSTAYIMQHREMGGGESLAAKWITGILLSIKMYQIMVTLILYEMSQQKPQLSVGFNFNIR